MSATRVRQTSVQTSHAVPLHGAAHYLLSEMPLCSYLQSKERNVRDDVTVAPTQKFWIVFPHGRLCLEPPRTGW